MKYLANILKGYTQHEWVTNFTHKNLHLQYRL